MSDEPKKRKAVYNPEADKKWREKNKERVAMTNKKSNARFVIRNGTIEDVKELYLLALERLREEGVEM